MQLVNKTLQFTLQEVDIGAYQFLPSQCYMKRIIVRLPYDYQREQVWQSTLNEYNEKIANCSMVKKRSLAFHYNQLIAKLTKKNQK